jgi:hypothetical protein
MRPRAPLAARVQECINVLCGKAQPDLFAGVDEGEHRADGAAEYQAANPPLVCAPVGSGLLVNIPGLTNRDITCLNEVGLKTLSDLEEECGGDLANVPGLLESWVDEYTRGDADRVMKCIERHLRPELVPAKEPTGVQYPPNDDWRGQGLAIMGIDAKLLKVCKREEVLTIGDLHDWVDEDCRADGGFFGPGVLAKKLREVAKLTAVAAESQADRLYQFFADRGFRGVPEKEAA